MTVRQNQALLEARYLLKKLNALYPNFTPYSVTSVGNRRIFIARQGTSPLEQIIFTGKTNADALANLKAYVNRKTGADNEN